MGLLEEGEVGGWMCGCVGLLEEGEVGACVCACVFAVCIVCVSLGPRPNQPQHGSLLVSRVGTGSDIRAG